MSLHFKDLNEALNNYGLNPDLLPAQPPESDGVEEDTKPAVLPPAPDPSATIKPLLFASAPSSPAYAVVDALIAWSESAFGGAVVKADPVRGYWDIRLSEHLGARVALVPLTTVITLHARVSGRWIVIDRLRYPALSLAERGRLFYFRGTSRKGGDGR